MANSKEVERADAPRADALPSVKCRKCNSEIADAKKCSVCGALQKNVKPCRICADLIPFEANYCNACKSYQGAFRYVSFSSTMVALIAAVLSLLVALAPHVDAILHRGSNTSFTVTGADANAIYVHVMNSGHKPSIIRECSLTFVKDKIAAMVTVDFVQGDTHDAKNVIHPTSEATVGLTAPGLATNPDDETPVTLQMNIEESSGKSTKTETFPARRIHEFFAAKVPAGKL